MDYLKIYNCLIINRQNNQISKDNCYCEKHHIIPKSEGGNNKNSNLVYLTAREHYIAHLLLAKIYNDYKMLSAVTYFHTKAKDHKRDIKFNSHLYDTIRKNAFSNDEYKKHVSERVKKQWKDVEYRKRMCEMRTGVKKSEQHCQSISNALKGRILTKEQIDKVKIGLRNHYINNPECKQKLSEIAKKRNSDPEYIQKISESVKKKYLDPEYKERIANLTRKVICTPEFRQKMKEVWNNNPELIQKQSQNSKQRWENTEFRQKMTQISKQRWENTEFRQKMSLIYSDSEFRKKQSQNSKQRWENPEFRKKQSEKIKIVWNDPELRKKQSEAQKNRWTEIEKEKQSDIMKKRFMDLDFREKMSKIYNDSERRKKQSEYAKDWYLTHESPMKGKHLSEETKLKISKSRISICNNPDWIKSQSEKSKQWHLTHEHPLKGKKRTDEERKKMSESKKLRFLLKVPKGISLQHYLKDHPEINIDNLK